MRWRLPSSRGNSADPAAGQGNCAHLPGEFCVCSVRKIISYRLGADGEIQPCEIAGVDEPDGVFLCLGALA